MAVKIVILISIFGFISAFPTESFDNVIAKMDPGPRFQYMAAPDGPELVDLWLKTSDVLAARQFDPDRDNNYHLFTRSNPNISQPIPLGATNILQYSHFDPEKKTVFLVHGWMNTPQSDFNVQLVHAYLVAEDVNLFMVDWSIGAGENYLVSLLNVKTSGEHVTKYITWLNSATGAKISNYHIIGHSLGAHQVGIIGRGLGGEVPYITALDPAMPGWILNPDSFKATDAIYTEVIHTDAGIYGRIRPSGDVDFYPNGGHGQPGCSNHNCHHHRALFLMAESLMWGGFTAQRCDSWLSALVRDCESEDTLQMGGPVPKTGSTGFYYLTTNDRSPFSQG